MKGVVIRPDKEEGCGDRPLLIIFIKLKEFLAVLVAAVFQSL